MTDNHFPRASRWAEAKTIYAANNLLTYLVKVDGSTPPNIIWQLYDGFICPDESAHDRAEQFSRMRRRFIGYRASHLVSLLGREFIIMHGTKITRRIGLIIANSASRKEISKFT